MGAARYLPGQAVWVSPSTTGGCLSEDEAVVLEDFDTGYLVLQESEVCDSHGEGHFVPDFEVGALVPALVAA